MTLSWVSVDLKTGRVLADFPYLSVPSVAEILGGYTSTTATLPVASGDAAPPPDWERATLEGATAMILLDDDQDGSQSRPLWGGYVNRQLRTLGDAVELSLITLEGYLDRRFVGDVTYTGISQTTIVSNLIASFVNDGTITIRVQATASATTRDRTYTDASDKSIYSVLTELMGVQGGPEWTIGWEWQHTPERITPVLYVADRIGSSPKAGLSPAAVFEAPGPVTEAASLRDYATGKGANRVIAASSATADVRPQSVPQVAPASERPTFEHRFTPSTAITSVPTLNSHAQSALALMKDGARSLTLAANAAEAPRLGVEWSIGDDLGYQIGGLDSAGVDTIPAFPGGLSGVARAIGWEWALTEPQTIAPVLAVI